MWKFCLKVQFLYSFGQNAWNYAETVPFHKISTPGNYVKYRYSTIQYSAPVVRIINLFPANHCVKSLQIRSYFWSVFPCIRIEYVDLQTVLLPLNESWSPKIVSIILNTPPSSWNKKQDEKSRNIQNFCFNWPVSSWLSKAYKQYLTWCATLQKLTLSELVLFKTDRLLLCFVYWLYSNYMPSALPN